jgi:hypothetical protein
MYVLYSADCQIYNIVKCPIINIMLNCVLKLKNPEIRGTNWNRASASPYFRIF